MSANPRQLSILDYTYQLPEERIALYPLDERDQSKLLVFKDGRISDHQFTDLPAQLSNEHVLVVNNTRVVQARLLFKKPEGSTIEILCLNPVAPYSLFEQAFHAKQSCIWECMVGNAKRWKQDWIEQQFNKGAEQLTLKARITGRISDRFLIEFTWQPYDLMFAEVLAFAGLVPLPPYLNRNATAADIDSYQTVYARHEGSVAAPTAGLHFTPNVLTALNKKGVQRTEVTLHVGAGTFKPVKSETMQDHAMHAEWIQVSRQTLQQLTEALRSGKKITGVGTTSARTLESLYWMGLQVLNGKNDSTGIFEISQWEPYDNASTLKTTDVFEHLLTYLEKHQLDSISGQTQIIIAPGYSFKVLDALITNFHQPQSTLLLLIAACVGDYWKKIYEHALAADYRFLSYGDSSLLFISKNN